MFKCFFFHENGYTILWIFYFVVYFHHETKSKTGNEIGQKFNFLWFPQKLTVFRKSGKKFQAFWSTEVWSGYGSKMFTWTLNTRIYWDQWCINIDWDQLFLIPTQTNVALMLTETNSINHLYAIILDYDQSFFPLPYSWLVPTISYTILRPTVM